MAKITKDEFISSLKEMTLLEVKELVDAMKEEFGVDQVLLQLLQLLLLLLKKDLQKLQLY